MKLPCVLFFRLLDFSIYRRKGFFSHKQVFVHEVGSCKPSAALTSQFNDMRALSYYTYSVNHDREERQNMYALSFVVRISLSASADAGMSMAITSIIARIRIQFFINHSPFSADYMEAVSILNYRFSGTMVSHDLKISNNDQKRQALKLWFNSDKELIKTYCYMRRKTTSCFCGRRTHWTPF